MKLLRNNCGQMGMIGAAVGLFITLVIVIVVYYNIQGAIDTTTLDDTFATNLGHTPGSAVHNATTPALNATTATSNQAATFFTIAPIIGIVIVAVVILNYVQRIGG